jgi:tetratricopeptide (TPR) repeat protein
MLTLMMNYAVSNESAFGYHVTNVVLHLINVVLIFYFIYLLSDKKWQVALITAVFFGIHPMHVESVAWISERKDVLYAAFFVGALIQYLKFLSGGKRKFYIYTLVLFALSLLSKPAAVVLPLTLLLIDCYRGRSLRQIKLWLEKVPFFALSLAMGVLTILVQTDRGAVANLELIPLSRKFFFACYGLMMYLAKLLVPIKMTTFYPFPTADITMPVTYYVAPVVVAVLAATTYFSHKKWSKSIGFGMLFFLINIVLVLQIVSVGSAVMADRYTYLPYVGCFYLFGCGYYYLWRTNHPYLKLATAALYVYVVLLTFLGYRQSTTWHDSGTLWNHAINVWPSAHAYTNRGLQKKGEGDIEGSLKDYNTAIEMNTGDATAFTNRGNIYFAKGQLDLALQDYDKAFRLNPSDPKLFANRGAVYSQRKQFDLAIADLSKAIELDPYYAEAIMNRALTYDAMQQPAKVLADLTRYLELRPKEHGVYNLRALAYNKLGDMQKALDDLSTAISMDGSSGMYYQNRSLINNAMGRKTEALSDAHAAQRLGGQFQPGYLESLQ